MAYGKQQHRKSADAADIDRLLTDSYSQLLKWANVITRGDEGRSQDLVQELCLYFTVAKPDLSTVANLDGYLYTSLRHLYISGLARSSREALRFVSVADCDSIDFALARNHTGDLLQRQNDLRRICNYAVWRKETSKSASYFVLHFFHGYKRQEVADIARLPIAAIYNKLKIARGEVKAYLENEGKLRIMKRDTPPTPVSSWDTVSAAELFRELRQTIMRSRMTECLEEDELVAHYDSFVKAPVSCGLLAHIVSCERCLLLIDRHFKRPSLKDRDTLENIAVDLSPSAYPVSISSDRRRAMQMVRNRWEKVHEHRPRVLSIAVDGQIVASHDVDAEHSNLFARIQAKDAEFVEVFSEQDVRFALLPIGNLPPLGPGVQTLRVSLSDSRWLELSLTFDGFGLIGEVAYFDPALAFGQFENEHEEYVANVRLNQVLAPRTGPRRSWFRSGEFASLFYRLLPMNVAAWALALLIIVGTGGYVTYRFSITTINAADILHRSIAAESGALMGQTKHQIFRVEEVEDSHHTVQLGTLEVLVDGDDKRQIRRFYDAQNHLIVAQAKNGERAEQSYRSGLDAGTFDIAALDDIWNEDLSIDALSQTSGERLHAAKLTDGYELKAVGPFQGYPHVLSLSVSLNRNLHPTQQLVGVSDGRRVRTLRLVQMLYQRLPANSLPDSDFELSSTGLRRSEGSTAHSSIHYARPNLPASAAQMANLEIGVLFQLSNTGSDINEPIEISHMPDGRIRITGTVADEARLGRILSDLNMLPDRRSLLIDLTTPREAEVRTSSRRTPNGKGTVVFDGISTNPFAESLIRKRLQAQGLKGEALEKAYAHFSHDALQHSEFALQHAYALQRLGQVLPVHNFDSLDRSSRHYWAAMVQKHSSSLDTELRALDFQLAQVLPPEPADLHDAEPIHTIREPLELKTQSDQILKKTQTLNQNVGRLFASDGENDQKQDASTVLREVRLSIPLRDAAAIKYFSRQLLASEESGSTK